MGWDASPGCQDLVGETDEALLLHAEQLLEQQWVVEDSCHWTIFEDLEDELQHHKRRSEALGILARAFVTLREENLTLRQAGFELQDAYEQLQEQLREAVGDAAYYRTLVAERCNTIDVARHTLASSSQQDAAVSAIPVADPALHPTERPQTELNVAPADACTQWEVSADAKTVLTARVECEPQPLEAETRTIQTSCSQEIVVCAVTAATDSTMHPNEGQQTEPDMAPPAAHSQPEVADTKVLWTARLECERQQLAEAETEAARLCERMQALQVSPVSGPAHESAPMQATLLSPGLGPRCHNISQEGLPASALCRGQPSQPPRVSRVGRHGGVLASPRDASLPLEKPLQSNEGSKATATLRSSRSPTGVGNLGANFAMDMRAPLSRERSSSWGQLVEVPLLPGGASAAGEQSSLKVADLVGLIEKRSRPSSAGPAPGGSRGAKKVASLRPSSTGLLARSIAGGA